jgi:hypothetical protein
VSGAVRCLEQPIHGGAGSSALLPPVKHWPAANAERIEMHLMPRYSLELNPAELLKPI